MLRGEGQLGPQVDGAAERRFGEARGGSVKRTIVGASHFRRSVARSLRSSALRSPVAIGALLGSSLLPASVPGSYRYAIGITAAMGRSSAPAAQG